MQRELSRLSEPVRAAIGAGWSGGLLAGLGLMLAAALLTPDLAFAQDATEATAEAAEVVAAAAGVGEEVAFILNSLLFLIGGFLVMFMAAGFAMLEAGMVRKKNVAVQCLKNISLYSIAGIMY